MNDPIPRIDFVRREIAVSVAVNALMSAAICWLVFGGVGAVPIWGLRGLVADFAPQGFMIGVMGAAVPALMARRARTLGAVEGVDLFAPSVGALVRRAFGWAPIVALGATAVAAAAFSLAPPTSLPFAATLAIKVAAGALLALVVTPAAVRAALN